MEEKTISLATLAQGAAVERFDLALQEVLTNIQDPNTDYKVKRTVTLKVTIEADERREIGKTTVACDAKLAPIKAFGVTLFMGADDSGKGVATEVTPPKQGELFPPEKPVTVDKVYKMIGGKE